MRTSDRAELKAIANLYRENKRIKFWSFEDSLKQLFKHKNTETQIYNCEGFKILPTHQLAIDFETTGFDCKTNKLLGVGLTSAETLETIYINCWDYENDCQRDLTFLSEYLRIINNNRPKWYVHNAKFEGQWFFHYFGEWMSNVHDTYVMAYCFDHRLQLNIVSLAESLICRYPETLGDILGVSKDKITPELMKSIPVKTLGEYCGEDTLETVLIFRKLKELMPTRLFELYDRERHNILLAAMMEYHGTLLDTSGNKELDDYCELELETIREIINNYIGYEINPNSSQQLSKALFETIGLSTDDVPKNKTGFSVAKDVLKQFKYEHPVIELLLENSTIRKLHTSFIKPLGKLVDENNRIHTNYNVCSTATGRWSSDNPNLQNIPNAFKSELGKKIRNVFVSRENWYLLKIDYSQFELRLLAHLSDDKFLVNAFNENESADIHTMITKLLFSLEHYDGKNPEHKRLRTLCKRMNFGIIYGMTRFRLYEESANDGNPLTLEQCQYFIDLWWSKLPGVAAWMDSVRLGAIVKGYTEDLLGRRRYFDFDHEYLQSLRRNPHSIGKNFRLSDIKIKWNRQDSAKLRQAGNAPVQGSNASVIRRVMHKIYDLYVHGEFQLETCVPLLQVHDELVFEVHESELNYYTKKITQVMETCVSLKVPIKCDPIICQAWGGGE